MLHIIIVRAHAIATTHYTFAIVEKRNICQDLERMVSKGVKMEDSYIVLISQNIAYSFTIPV